MKKLKQIAVIAAMVLLNACSSNSTNVTPVVPSPADYSGNYNCIIVRPKAISNGDLHFEIDSKGKVQNAHYTIDNVSYKLGGDINSTGVFLLLNPLSNTGYIFNGTIKNSKASGGASDISNNVTYQLIPL
jgi:hypothetical protein